MGAKPRDTKSAQRADHYDLALFEQLNAEYRDKRVVRNPQGKAPKSYAERAASVLERVQRYVDIEDRAVVELGCGEGWLTSLLVPEAGARSATGIDVREGRHWDRHDRRSASYMVGDLSQDDLLEEQSADLVISSVVFEHVRRPLQMLSALHRVLRPNGQAWLRFNLYRGPKASHTYREVFFPWPHLLFRDSVCVDFYAKHHGRRRAFSWVNKLTAAEYCLVSREAGFSTTKVDLHCAPIDVEFYCRFEDVLGRYPALDLETDFMTLVLTKQDLPGDPPQLGYLDRQQALDEILRGRPAFS